jgi:hypothetical protein
MIYGTIVFSMIPLFSQAGLVYLTLEYVEVQYSQLQFKTQKLSLPDIKTRLLKKQGFEAGFHKRNSNPAFLLSSD